jgi:hypothetical protein
MDANSGPRWISVGATFAQTASFLCRDEDDVRQKARHLGLVEHPARPEGPR